MSARGSYVDQQVLHGRIIHLTDPSSGAPLLTQQTPVPVMSTKDTSAYVPLPHTGDFIRLLALSPGAPDHELVGEFLVHDLKDAEPQYTATSYVCGDDSRSRHHIMMSGSKLGIYKNADEVLRRFRSSTDTTYLWIDVVCIDQDDLVEKAREVALMFVASASFFFIFNLTCRF